MLQNKAIQGRGLKLSQVLILLFLFPGFTPITNAQTENSNYFYFSKITDTPFSFASSLESTSRVSDPIHRLIELNIPGHITAGNSGAAPIAHGPSESQLKSDKENLPKGLSRWLRPRIDVRRIEFTNDELPPNLYSEFTGNKKTSSLQYCLPAYYSKEKNYPLLVYVPGYHGHPGGNIKNAVDIANNRECIVASLPLFKTKIDRTEPGRGIIISLCDYSVLSSAYKVMLEKLFQTIPNIDSRKSAMVGFSNGAIAIAVLVSSHDEYILNKFQSFCLVEQGMFHLTDLHKTPTKDRRFLILVGDKEDYGRDLKIRGAKLVRDAYQVIGCSVESRILKNTGHELTQSCKRDIGTWVFEDHKSND